VDLVSFVQLEPIPVQLLMLLLLVPLDIAYKMELVSLVHPTLLFAHQVLML
jgi:hypothetical protein